ncbi:MAG: class C sortase [Suipraeoptans sp.]
MGKELLNKLSGFLLILLFLVGGALVAYPTLSNYYNEKMQGEIISGYQNEVGVLSEEEKEEILEKARIYNEDLVGNVVLTDPFNIEGLDNQNTEYEELLNPFNDGMMGYIDIPDIDVYLPIYHGTNDDTLKTSVGHLMNTSLPVGGTGSHAVLSAHSGLPSAKLFTNLDLLEKGDVFYIDIVGEIFAYEIDQIKVVEPHEIDDLLIDIDKDFVTLVTCTPYGINSHRLLVRGVRVPYTEEEKERISTEKEKEGWPKIWLLIPIAMIVVTAVIVAIRKKKRQGYED